jgi:hypothetical protein
LHCRATCRIRQAAAPSVFRHATVGIVLRDPNRAHGRDWKNLIGKSTETR